MIEFDDPFADGQVGTRKMVLNDSTGRDSLTKTGLNSVASSPGSSRGSSTSLTASKAKFSKITTDVENGPQTDTTERLVAPSSV